MFGAGLLTAPPVRPQVSQATRDRAVSCSETRGRPAVAPCGSVGDRPQRELETGHNEGREAGNHRLTSQAALLPFSFSPFRLPPLTFP